MEVTMREIPSLKRIVMQPTSLCNLDCIYCYLAHRDENNKMPISVAEKVANSISLSESSVRIIWHGGEPLSCGPSYFSELLKPFDVLRKENRVQHSIQTNATLINDEWCDLFKIYDIHIGISVDGPDWANRRRVDWAGKPVFDKVLRGAQFLTDNSIEFSSICVVGTESLSRASELYDFFSKFGCNEVGFNLEEKIGVYNGSVTDSNEEVLRFWEDLYKTWKQNPIISVREITRTLQWIQNPVNPYRNESILDPFPCVAHNGAVVLLSPEFLDAKSEKYGDFVAGNINNETLSVIISRAEELLYVKDFQQGVATCSSTCEYFDFCRGGQASNKFFELETTNGSETLYCRNSEQRLLKAVLSSL